MKRSVSVDVAGQKLQLRTDAEESYVASLAEFVNEKIGEVKAGSSGSGKTVSTQVLAVLAALRIADELFQARRSDADLRRQVRERSRRILTLLESAETGPENQRDDD